MKEITISKHEDPLKRDYPSSDRVWLTCKDFNNDLDRYIAVAKRMRPDRIIIDFEGVKI